MQSIFYKTNVKNKEENIFFSALQKKYNDCSHLNYDFQLPENYLNFPIITSELLNSVQLNKFISIQKKKIATEFLIKLPGEVKPARTINNISIDFVIQENNTITFIEFHEKQHYRLSDKRLKPIFSYENDRFEVPRFLQRLMKDYWRWKYLSNYKIIWHNWYETNNLIPNFQNNKNEEFNIENKFNFKSLI